ncbi:class I SAM-dependent methyltransferase [Amycolatopsis panacis]|uniref:Methyltransferase domain-containing protein n=1 Tax=Amycolatopsis panacis TaxID=2340917 RepID=A0A419HJE9_9PSEU|nr:class I SAM-dependent methyltransferase [Amycolatopsis panacis]RJQ75894.1 methyltransferase domain-containing protein [Amycolatopsis panacis]
MADRARVRELMLGVEGLALMRSAIDGDEDFIAARIDEISKISAPDTAAIPPVELLSELDVATGYRVWSENYDSLPNFFLTAEEPVVAGLLADLPPGQALDAACGTGRHTTGLVARGHEVIGVDQSPEMMRRAKTKVPSAEFRIGDLERLPVTDHAVDLAVCALALSHLNDIGPAIGEFRRVLRPGGRLIVTEVHPMMVLLQGPALFSHKPGELAFIRYHAHLASEYLAAFAEHGFAVRSCHEPLFTGPLAPGGYEELIPEAANAAWAGLPVVIVWEAEAIE